MYSNKSQENNYRSIEKFARKLISAIDNTPGKILLGYKTIRPADNNIRRQSRVQIRLMIEKKFAKKYPAQ